MVELPKSPLRRQRCLRGNKDNQAVVVSEEDEVVATSVIEEVVIKTIPAEVETPIRAVIHTPEEDIKAIRIEAVIIAIFHKTKVLIAQALMIIDMIVIEAIIMETTGEIEEATVIIEAVTTMIAGEVTTMTIEVMTAAIEEAITTKDGVAEVVIVRKIFSNSRNGLKLMILFKLIRLLMLISTSRSDSTINSILPGATAEILEVEGGRIIIEEVEVATVKL